MNQTQLGEKSGLAQSFISNLEGRTKLPTMAVLKKVARGLGISWESFVPESIREEYAAKYGEVFVSEDQKLLDELADVL